MLHATKVVSTTPKQIAVVGIVREKLFGPDTIEEALKTVDSLSTRGTTRVLLGINDQEFALIEKSVFSRNNLKGRFMSPLVVLCKQNYIPIECVGRKISATSSRLSNAAFWNPVQFYKTLWLVSTKSWSQVRAPSARKYIDKSIPIFSRVYFTEGSECMTLKIAQAVERSSESYVVTVVPMENYFDVLESLEDTLQRVPSPARLEELELESAGLWIPVVLLYLMFPMYVLYRIIQLAGRTELTELANYETQGIALGTWVRDTRRD